ncbi:unnamed protein product [Rhodiola kirilowii]
MGWRRAFCTGPPKAVDRGDDSDERIFKSADPPPPQSSSSSTRFGGTLNFFTSSSNPSTPRLKCRTSSSFESRVSETESSESKSTTPKIDKPLKSPKSSAFGSNASSPKSPLKLALFRNSFRSRNGCGVCGHSVKSGRGTAVYTAQCGHVFHFPCIATHVRGTSGKKLTCVVCNAEWSDEPLLAVHQNVLPSQLNKNNVEFEEKQVISTPTSQPQPPSPSSSASSPRQQFHHFQTRPVHIKSYDDDEPLTTPRASRMAFNPIPESEDEGEETSTTILKVKTESNRRVEIRLMPDAALVSATSEHQTCAMVLKVKAPQLPQTARSSRRMPLLDASRRAPIDLVTVLDVSGSMMGEKMQMMRRAMRLVISSLGSQDRLSIVAFSAVPKRLLPFKRMTQSGQRAARAIVDRLECSQGSCVSDALRKASKVLEDRRERNPVSTIILLSDGQDDSPESQRPAPLPSHRSTTRFAHVEIPVNSPSDGTFAKWVGGLLSVVIQDLKIVLGSSPAEITAVYCSDRQAPLLRSSTVALGDLYAEEERELLVELRVPVAAVRLEKVLTVKCSYKDPATHERITTKQEAFIIPVACSSPGIQRLRNVFISTRAVAESRRIMEHGEFESAHRLLSSARALLMQSASMSGEECVHVLEGEIMKLARRRQEQQMVEQERIMAAIRRQRISAEATPPSSAGKKTSWNRVSDLHGFENARF